MSKIKNITELNYSVNKLKIKNYSLTNNEVLYFSTELKEFWCI